METDGQTQHGQHLSHAQVGQSKGTLASRQDRKLSNDSKSLALDPWSMSFSLLLFKILQLF